jgi:hypothetical protein
MITAGATATAVLTTADCPSPVDFVIVAGTPPPPGGGGGGALPSVAVHVVFTVPVHELTPASAPRFRVSVPDALVGEENVPVSVYVSGGLFVVVVKLPLDTLAAVVDVMLPVVPQAATTHPRYTLVMASLAMVNRRVLSCAVFPDHDPL